MVESCYARHTCTWCTIIYLLTLCVEQATHLAILKRSLPRITWMIMCGQVRSCERGPGPRWVSGLCQTSYWLCMAAIEKKWSSLNCDDHFSHVGSKEHT